MKQRALVALVVLGFSMTGAQAFAQQGRDRNDNRDGDRVCFYRDIEYQGPSWCYRPGDELADLRNRGDEISSIRIFGRARVIVADINYQAADETGSLIQTRRFHDPGSPVSASGRLPCAPARRRSRSGP